MPPAGARRLLAIVISVGAVTASRNLLLEDHVPHHLHPRPYHELERVYDELDNYTREDPNTSWVGDRLWSIASMALYNMTKTHYMYNHLIMTPHDPPPVVCELGFNGGHSATTFLESLPTAKVYSFDLGDTPWSQRNSKHLTEKYAPRFEYIKGNSRDTLPPKKNSGLDCDILLIDGSKDPAVREKDIYDFRNISHKGARLFFDESSNFPCVSGQLDPSDPSCKVGYYTDTSAMYNKLCKAGVLKMFDCAQSHTAEDTLCFGEYLI